MIRLALGAVVLLVMGVAIFGIGMGDAPAEKQPPPSTTQIQVATARIAASATTGRKLFSDEGCDRCHSIAAIGADGKLGPRLDTLDDDADDIEESVTDPRDEIEDGFSAELMPADYGEELSRSEIAALAAFIATASNNDEVDQGDRGRGRGRGRGGRGRGGGED